MGSYVINYEQNSETPRARVRLAASEMERFNPSLLEIGDVSAEGRYKDALAAIFDLEGFTSFCNQIDPYLVIPDFLEAFLSWIFSAIAKGSTASTKEGFSHLHCRLPFFAKFLGDGVLFLWDTSDMSTAQIGNAVVLLRSVCGGYRTKFLKEQGKQFVRVPVRLRCGVARGQVTSICEGRDFVGPCINSAARLQKLGQLGFAFSGRGFSKTKYFIPKAASLFVLARVRCEGSEMRSSSMLSELSTSVSLLKIRSCSR